jgi:regulator of sigma E protease
VNASDSLGSVISIGNTFPIMGLAKFWTLTAIFSIILAFIKVFRARHLMVACFVYDVLKWVSGRNQAINLWSMLKMTGMVLLLG